MTASAAESWRVPRLVGLWAVVAVVSPLSEVVAQWATGGVPAQLLWVRILVLAGVAARWRGLRAFSFAYLYQLAMVALVQWDRSSGIYNSLRAERGFIGSQAFLGGTLLVALLPRVLWVIPRARSFHFRVGDLQAAVGLPGLKPVRWSVAAPLFAVIAAVTSWAFVAFTGGSAGASAEMAGFAVLFAAMNAFSEEFLNRILLASAVGRDFGVMQAALVSGFIFGVGHWNGLPAGPLGVAMTFILGFVAAKAMFETRGMFWSWFMHFVPDCVLFYYWGIGSVVHLQTGSGRL